jgi:hypothetical protein
MINRFDHGTQHTLKRELIRALFLCLIGGLAFCCCAQAQTYYYVAKTGSDSNSGSASAPWLTIGHAALEAKAGSTVYVGAGTYSESVTFSNSGTSSAPIVFNGQGVAIVDGTSVACCTTPSFASSNSFFGTTTQGLLMIGASGGVSYVTVEGFTVQNYKTSSSSDVPLGIFVPGTGGGTGIQILNNTVKNIETTAGSSGNAYGLGVFGSSTTPLTNVTVSGNTVTGCLTGESETVPINGNIHNSTISNNVIYGNDNIGIDVEGYQGLDSGSSVDFPANIDVVGNTVYNNSAANNAGEGSSSGSPDYDQDGLYCDGCTQTIFERNTIYGNDIGIEAASEIAGCASSYVIMRNNLIYGSNYVGITIGGYGKSGTGTCKTGGKDAGGGSSEYVYILNNTLYDNGTQSSAGGSEFQTQYRVTNSYFENNIVYDVSSGILVFNVTKGAGLTANYNDYYTAASSYSMYYNGKAYASFSTYKSASGESDSIFANPDFTTTPSCTGTYTPPGGSGSNKATTCSSLGNTTPTSSSPVWNVGNAGLGTPGSAWGAYETSQPFVGTYDFTGTTDRVNASGEINMGAYE